VPDIVWDGITLPGISDEDILCFADNGDISFVNLDAANGFAAPTFDASTHDCSMPSLSVISLSSISD